MKGALDLAEIIAAMSPVAVQVMITDHFFNDVQHLSIVAFNFQTTKINLNYARDNKVDDSLDFAVSFEFLDLRFQLAYNLFA